MTNLKYIISGVVISIILFMSGLLVGRYKFYKTEIRVVEREVTKTEYKIKVEKIFDKSNFDNLLTCYESPITFKNSTDKNYLYVTAGDLCKDATVKYEIKSAGNMRLYFTVGIAGLVVGAGTGIYLYHRHK
jgi:hypothetical protein